MRKKSCLTILLVSLALLGLVSTPVMATDVAVDKISISGSAIFAAGWKSFDEKVGTDTSDSDLALSMVELAFDAKVNELVNVHALLYYDNPIFDAGTPLQWEEAIVTIGDAEKFLAVGLMFAPFGAQQSHFPGDPVIAVPITLAFGETHEEAILVGAKHQGLSAAAYTFRGHWDEVGNKQHIESYGVDVNYTHSDEAMDLTVGASYISNVAESEALEAALTATPALKDDVAGAAAYLHVGIADFFFEAEYMTALDDFLVGELSTGTPAVGAQPSVMNIEAGYNLEVAGKGLEVAVKYAASDEADNITGMPETRYGVCANLEVLEHTTVSLAYINDEAYNKDTTDMVLAVVAVEF